MISRSLHGWWEITWRNTPYYYHFNADGSSIWSRKKPASAAAPSFSVPLAGKGHWFHQAGKLTVIWQSSGSVEQFDQIVLDPMKNRFEIDGMYNAIEPIRGIQLV